MPPLLLHIPHASTYIPMYEGYVVDKDRLAQEILKLTDWYTDDLFESAEDQTVAAAFSRVFCDVERFSEDEREIMAQYGMGVLYTKTDDGADMRITDDLRAQILQRFYWKHHRQLSDTVQEHLLRYGKALIVDCHSYSDRPFLRDLDQTPERPDFCIGTDDFHTPNLLKLVSIEFFRQRGYSLGVNYPYAGSIVPMEHYQKNRAVGTIMLEINRRLYLEEGTNTKNSNYPKIKEVVKAYLAMMRDCVLKQWLER